MSDTPQLGLPLLAAAQAQKHVTMNEALLRLDALSAPSAITDALSIAPTVASDGDAYLIGTGASGVWAGHEGELAFFVNGGWSFAAPRPGWRLWLLDQGRHTTFVGDRWVGDLIGPTENGALGAMQLNTCDLDLSLPNLNLTPVMIPAFSIVLCLTARVLEEITGTLQSWRMGILGDPRRYGDDIGTVQDSTAVGFSSSPLAYYSDEVLRIAPNDGLFSGGRIRFSLHYMTFQPADAVHTAT